MQDIEISLCEGRVNAQEGPVRVSSPSRELQKVMFRLLAETFETHCASCSFYDLNVATKTCQRDVQRIYDTTRKDRQVSTAFCCQGAKYLESYQQQPE